MTGPDDEATVDGPGPDPKAPALPGPSAPRGLAALERARESARRYGLASHGDATWRAYASDFRIFETWCREHGLEALPATPDTLAAFLADEADRGRAPSTLQRRIAAIRLAHLGIDAPPPHQAIGVQQVMRGIRRTVKRTVAKAAPALDEEVRAMVDAIDAGSVIGLRDRALLLVGFAGALRRSELRAMRIEHLERHPKGIVLLIPDSKGDREAKGQHVALLARPASRYCPVGALDDWLGRARLASGPVFRKVSRAGRVGTEALNGSSITDAVKRAVGRVEGLDVARYSPHSLRHGMLTSAARGGADVFRMRAHSRHRQLQTLLGYVEDGERFDRHAAEGLLDDVSG